MTLGQFMDRALTAFGGLFTLGTATLSLLMVIILATIIKKRNHLDKRRVISNIAGYAVSATLFLCAALFSIPLNDTSMEWIVFIVVATVLVCLAILVAKFWEQYEAGPFAILRGQLSDVLLNIALFISPTAWAEKEEARIASMRRSLDTIQGVIDEKRLQGILPAIYNDPGSGGADNSPIKLRKSRDARHTGTS